MSIKIITDSTSYIPEHLLEQYDISIVSLNIILDGESKREVDLSNHTFYEEMAKVSSLPTSSQPIPEEMFHVFEDQIQKGHSVLGIFLSSEMSGTFASAHLIKDMLLEKYPTAKIELLDSRTNCMQMGFVALEAAKAANEGLPMADVIKIAQSVIDNSRFIFTPDTLTYLQKGGRIGNASALLGNLLQIKPILTVVDGKTDIYTKVRTKKKAISTLIDILLNDVNTSNTLGDVIVHHINCESEGEELAKLLSEKLNRPVPIQSIGPVIGLHVGPGSIGIAYHTYAN